jgi:hypothetical protein
LVWQASTALDSRRTYADHEHVTDGCFGPTLDVLLCDNSVPCTDFAADACTFFLLQYAPIKQFKATLAKYGIRSHDVQSALKNYTKQASYDERNRPADLLDLCRLTRDLERNALQMASQAGAAKVDLDWYITKRL